MDCQMTAKYLIQTLCCRFHVSDANEYCGEIAARYKLSLHR